MNAFLDLLLDPLQWTFMQRGLLAALLVGIACALLGTFVILRGLSFIGDAVAHAALPGIVIAAMLKGSFFVGAFASGLLTALGIGWIGRRSNLKEDAAIGIAFTGMFALGILLLGRLEGYTQDLTHILFGNVLGIAPTDLILSGIVTGATVLLVLLLYKELVLSTFDPTHAAAAGIPLSFVHNILLVLLALVVVVGIQAVGVVLVAALLVTPGATGRLLCRRLPGMMLVAVGAGVVSTVAGLYISYYVAVASGPAIVLCATGLFFTALFAKEITLKL